MLPVAASFRQHQRAGAPTGYAWHERRKIKRDESLRITVDRVAIAVRVASDRACLARRDVARVHTLAPRDRIPLDKNPI
jgi:hypothetical protein